MFNNNLVVFIFSMITITTIVVECQFFSKLPEYRTYPRIGKRSFDGSSLMELISGDSIQKKFERYNSQIKILNSLIGTIDSEQVESFLNEVNSFLDFEIYKMSKTVDNQ